MIEDSELRALFQAESEEHLQSLEAGLLQFEAAPGAPAGLAIMFRAAHTLKGCARMLGVIGLERLAHEFEDQLGAARLGHAPLSAEAIQRLFRGLDAMRHLAHEAITGEAAPVDLSRVLAELRGEELAPEPPVKAAPSRQDKSEAERTSRAIPLAPTPADRSAPVVDEETALPASVPQDASPAPASLRSDAAFKIETIRVEPQRLDTLMTRAGELVVTTTRMRRGLAAVAELEKLWEAWSRDAAACRLSPGKVEGGHTGAGKLLARFQAQEQERLARLGGLVERLRHTAGEDVAWLDLVADELSEAVRGMRLLPLATLFNLFPRLVRDLAHEQGKEVQLVVTGGETSGDKRLLEEMKDPLMHLIRNSIDHGLEPPDERERQGKPRVATLALRAYQTAAHVVIEVADDGRGLDEPSIRRTALKRGLGSAEELAALRTEQLHALIFSPGFSTSPLITDVSGRGVGLDVVRENVERLKGSLRVESVPGAGCTFRIRTPITLATSHVLLVRAGAPGALWPYALPIEFVQDTFLVAPDEVFSLDGRPAIAVRGQPVSVARLADLLELPAGEESRPVGPAGSRPREDGMPCILLAVDQERFAVFVEKLVDQQEVILKPLGGLLQRVRNVSGVTILATGEICTVLNPADLLKTVKKAPAPVTVVSSDAEEVRRKVILLAEDSLTTRTQEKRILESAGYEVVTAVDGADAFGKLGARSFDAVVSDVEMPNMDGLQLAARIREDARYREVPILLVTSLASDEDRRRGAEVGANAYIVKGTFEQKALLDALGRLV